MKSHFRFDHVHFQISHQGGFVFKVCDMIRLRRYLVLGTPTETLYQTYQEINTEHDTAIKAILDRGDGEDIVKILKVCYSIKLPTVIC